MIKLSSLDGDDNVGDGDGDVSALPWCFRPLKPLCCVPVRRASSRCTSARVTLPNLQLTIEIHMQATQQANAGFLQRRGG